MIGEPEALKAETVPIGEAIYGHCLTLAASAENACYKATVEQKFSEVVSLKALLYLIVVRSPVDIVAVIDKSGSTSWSKITMGKESS